MEEKTDFELIDLALKGDKGAFGQLILRYQTMMRKFALKLVANEECTSELVQEAMLQAYLSLNRLHDPAKFKGWLYGIVLNVCRSYLRDQKQVFYSLEAISGGLQYDAIPFFTTAISPERIAEEKELNQTVLEAINSLSSKDREITLRFYYDELSLHEIATLQGVSVNAVKIRLYRARQRLKTKLTSQYRELIPYISRRNNMIKVNVFDVVKQERTDSQGHSQVLYVVVLQEEANQRALPIWIGPFDGQAMAGTLGGLSFPRPLTFEFIAKLLNAIEAQIKQVRIETLKGNTFYATVQITCGQRSAEIDARPSDAINLALLTSAPIFVSEEVLSSAGVEIPQTGKISAQRTGVESILKEMEEMQKQALNTFTNPKKSKEEILKSADEFIRSVFGGSSS